MRQDTPIKGIFLNDLKIKIRGKEDRVYLSNWDIYTKLRRGFCIIENTNKNEFKIARKGLIKFFDYKTEFSLECKKFNLFLTFNLHR